MLEEERQKNLSIEYFIAFFLLVINLIFYKQLGYTEEIRFIITILSINFGTFLILFNIRYFHNYKVPLYIVSYVVQTIAWTMLPILSSYSYLSITVYIAALIVLPAGVLQVSKKGVYLYPLLVFISLFFFRNFETMMLASIFCLCTVVLLGYRYFIRKQKRVLMTLAEMEKSFVQSRDYFFHALLNPLNIINGKLQLASIDKIDILDKEKGIIQDLNNLKNRILDFSVNDPAFKRHRTTKDHFLHREYYALKKLLSVILCVIVILSLFLFKGFTGTHFSHHLNYLFYIACPLMLYILMIYFSIERLKFVAPLLLLVFCLSFLFFLDKIATLDLAYTSKLGFALISLNILSFHGRKWFALGAIAIPVYFTVFWGLPYSVIGVSFTIYMIVMIWIEIDYENYVMNLAVVSQEKQTYDDFINSLKKATLPKIEEMEILIAKTDRENKASNLIELKTMASSLTDSIKNQN